MKKVGFVCVHNSCRSQMAEAIGKIYGKNIFESYSAGTQIKDEINKDAAKIIKEFYGVDITQTQKSKLLKDIPKLDIIIKMGCNVVCPVVNGEYIEDWGLDDPTGKGEHEFKITAKKIEEKIKYLCERIKNGEI